MILYNPDTHKQQWHTVNGTRRDAEAFERDQKQRLSKGLYISKTTRKTFAEVAAMFLKERTARDRRTNTLAFYESAIRNHLLPRFGASETGSIRRSEFADHLDSLREQGATVQTVNRVLRAAKAVFYFGIERELIERNPVARFRPFEGVLGRSLRAAHGTLDSR